MMLGRWLDPLKTEEPSLKPLKGSCPVELSLKDGILSFTTSNLCSKPGDPEPLPYTSSITNVDYFLNRSLSHLIEHCLCSPGGGEEEGEGEEEEDLPPLHAELSLSVPSLDNLHQLLLQGCDPNQISCQGRAALHTLLSCDHASSVPIVPFVSVLLDAGASLEQTDSDGRSPLNCLEHLLVQERMEEAAQISELLLSYSAQPCDVNHIDAGERSLLSYSVTYLDRAAELTRVLVNHGGRVWPRPAPASPVSVNDLTRDREQSAFTWFLRSAVLVSNLDGAENTLTCLCHEMGRDPARMKAHVMRVMLSEAKYPRVLGPLYLQLKLAMAPFWSEPQHLRYLAWNSIRKSIGPKRLNSGSKQLGLPSPLRKYLTLASSRSSKD